MAGFLEVVSWNGKELLESAILWRLLFALKSIESITIPSGTIVADGLWVGAYLLDGIILWISRGVKLLSVLEETRLKVADRTPAGKKSQLGQFLTPASTASFMAALFPAASGECRLLDAGAGIGSLSSAFLERCVTGSLHFHEIHLKAFELDDAIHDELQHSLSAYLQKCNFSFEMIGKDFIEEASNAIQFQQYNFTHAILNPPYKKIGSKSSYRLLLRGSGIETVNLYSA